MLIEQHHKDEGRAAMSTLYLGTDIEPLAHKLAELLDQARGAGDFFRPAVVVVPNRYLAKWLRLRLARELGVAVNVKVEYLLEKVMWEMLKELDGRAHPAPLQHLDENDYRLMVLAALVDEEAGTELGPLREYLSHESREPGRDHWRRAWQLAGLLAALIRDYEYHRQDRLIRKWLNDEAGYPQADQPAQLLEQSQRALFRHVVREPDGLRSRLGQAVAKLCKTLPQYAGEVMELPPHQLRTLTPVPTVHFFGLTQISALHVRALRWLGERYDLRLYYLNPLIGHLAEGERNAPGDGTRSVPATFQLPEGGRDAGDVYEELTALADRFRAHDRDPAGTTQPANELLSLWGQAGAEGLWLMAGLLDGARPFAGEKILPSERSQANTVLLWLQDRLRNRPTADRPLSQDRSVQIVACPGIFREVETVRHSIVHNLATDESLKETDIAVLTTDMTRYRPALQAVFEREPRQFYYNLADYSAAELSVFGHAVAELLDLALESFSRTRVFSLLLNPCFLARLEVKRAQALVWLEWAEALGIHHGWDQKEKRARGYADSPLYSWQLGLRRLRLGRLMDAVDERADAPAPRFGEVIPYADLDSGDKEQLDAFARAVERLLPRMAELRRLSAAGARWAREIRKLIDDFLAVPADRPREEQVRSSLFQSLEGLTVLDGLRGGKTGLPLALVREYVGENLETLKAMTGDFLTGGVTVAALQPILPVPFRIIYVLGLGEGLFPGPNHLAGIDLRARERLGGDIRPAETNCFLFLQTLLAARQKVYLLYNNRDVQKDQELHPSSPVNQLRRHLEEHALGKKFTVADMPLAGSDPLLLENDVEGDEHDVFVNYSDAERLLAVDRARRAGGLVLTASDAGALQQRLEKAQLRFQLPACGKAAAREVPTVALSELGGFLRCPAEAALKRHLRLSDDEDVEPADDEPFYTAFPQDHRLLSATLNRFVGRAIQEGVDQALADWQARFAGLHDEWRLRGRVPEGAFATVDRARFVHILKERIEAPEQGLAHLLRELEKSAFCGPVLVGESLTPVGARQRFPALKLPLADGGTNGTPPVVRLVGTLPLVWKCAEAVDVLILTNRSREKVPADHLGVPLLEPALFLLILKAGAEPDSRGESSERWLGERAFRVHIAHAAGIASFSYGDGDVAANEARAYLESLTRDFLDRAGFDFLPFELLVANSDLKLPFLFKGDRELLAYLREQADWHKKSGTKEAKLSLMIEQLLQATEGAEETDAALLARLRTAYVEFFQDAVDEDGDNMKPAYRPSKLLEIVATQVPSDAFEKLRRRFWLLDRGPARARARK